jgi:hypothetical protein
MQTTILSALIALILFIPSQENLPFPKLEGTTLSDKVIIVPDSTKGQFTLLGLAYSKKAEDELMSWAKPMYNHFIFEPEDSFFPVEHKNVHMFFVPMFTGAKSIMEGKVSDDMKENIDKDFHDHVLVYGGSNKAFRDELEIDDKDIPYFFLLDKEGNIVYQTKGYYNEDKMIEMDKLITN